MSPATSPHPPHFHGARALVRSVERALSRLNTAEMHQRHVQDFHPDDKKAVAQASLIVHQVNQQVDTSVRMLRQCILLWAHADGIVLSAGEPIPFLAGTEYDGASLSDLEV